MFTPLEHNALYFFPVLLSEMFSTYLFFRKNE